MIKTFSEIVSAIASYPPARVAIAAAENRCALEAAKMAYEQNIATSLLVGDSEKIKSMAKEIGFDLANAQVIHEPNELQAAATAVRTVHDGRAGGHVGATG